jgi:2'-5' RNA ligase
MTTERLFVAVPLGEEQRSLLQRQQQALQETVPFQKWTHPLDLHITLKFLGDTPSDVSESIPPILQRVAADVTSFDLRISGLGTFGKPSLPSILWAGVNGDIQALGSLQNAVEAALAPLGFEPEERGYNPHITLARRYQGSQGFSLNMLTPHNVIDSANEAAWTISSLVLYRTHLGRKPSYEAAEVFPLG